MISNTRKTYLSLQISIQKPLLAFMRSLNSSYEEEKNELWFSRKNYFKPKISPMLPQHTFKGKTAFITGGGTGLGAGMAKLLSQLGANVSIVSRNIDVLKNKADEISSLTENEVLPIRCDVRSTESVRDAVSECIDKIGLPNIIINNAAGNFISPTVRLSSNAWNAILDIILNGTINVTTDIGKRLISAKQGANFLNVSTTYTMSGSAFTVPSACAKSGVETLTKSLASEWSVHGFRFNCIQPGPIQTQGSQNQIDPTGRFNSNKVNQIPLGRFGRIEEIANLGCYLVSDYSSWITGSIIKIDGGKYNFSAGPYNQFIETISDEEWLMIENLIKNRRETPEECVEQF